MDRYSANQHGVDVWHDGRFIDTWANEEIKKSLKKCFAHYEKEEIKCALIETEKLFTRLAKRVAELWDYQFPNIAREYANKYIMCHKIDENAMIL